MAFLSCILAIVDARCGSHTESAPFDAQQGAIPVRKVNRMVVARHPGRLNGTGSDRANKS